MTRPPLPEEALLRRDGTLTPRQVYDAVGIPVPASEYLAEVAAEQRAVGLGYVRRIAAEARADLGLPSDVCVTIEVPDFALPHLNLPPAPRVDPDLFHAAARDALRTAQRTAQVQDRITAAFLDELAVGARRVAALMEQAIADVADRLTPTYDALVAERGRP